MKYRGDLNWLEQQIEAAADELQHERVIRLLVDLNRKKQRPVFRSRTVSIQQIAQQLRNLPYNDMMVLAEYLAGKLGHADSASQFARVLSDLKDLPVAKVSETEARIEQQTKKIFNRVRTLRIEPCYNGSRRAIKGWSLTIPTVKHGAVQCEDLPTGFRALIENAVLTSTMVED